MDYVYVCFVICLDFFDFEYLILCRCYFWVVGSFDFFFWSYVSGDWILVSVCGGYVLNYCNVCIYILLVIFCSLCRWIMNVLSFGLDGVKWF